mmetsp:Transcript_6802/g.7719  ORF Transcript_6802/g.7719 Transcript_6802/m.7719 type:complete len:553 (+) Transcript_6802:105-1763(+)|eukprot:CAMPEP_0194139008 /NCGR_PEP_ID=MMETSP0152-20130528/8758_1 /TAXON_ID=1049557 /ORGANISM="Thalassiothrix antarctica, Strain L6-D1" /LENGTH=552 /DNA_ID=CAMNT_0038836709 /DNA_START=14 /DNA_END=1672 /DNA_ORIENTATION=-
MVAIKRQPNGSSIQASAITAIFIIFSVLIFYLATVTDDLPPQTNVTNGLKSSLRHSVVKQRQKIKSALQSLTTNQMPMRLQKLRESNNIVGEHLMEIRAGTETVEEVLHGQSLSVVRNELAKPPMEIIEVIEYLTGWIRTLHETLATKKKESHVGIWNAYHDLTVKTLYLWDREYLERMPERRDDGSIFLSIATYRDENCYNTVRNAFGKSKNPEKLFVGMVQQNCHEDCKGGILDASGRTEDVEPDQDCYKAFCDSAEGKSLCEKGHVRLLDVDEPESLGPYAARYFASKMWNGENWFMQIDAHMTFIQDWDALSIAMLKKAPSEKPVLSHYPPSEKMDLEKEASNPASRLCGPAFAGSDLESQIIRLEGASRYDKVKLSTPRFAPFTAAGYFVAHADFLREVPFDPFLPWIFMGEEIIMSSRLWTAGYDIFSPTQNVLGHIYVRRHKPKFWESVHRAFTFGVHNPLQEMVLSRIKYQLGYPESAKDMLKPKSLLTAVEQYSMGTERSLETYLELVGLNVTTKEVTYTGWCEEGRPPPGFEEFADLYTEEK